jgi:hypothetical protein
MGDIMGTITTLIMLLNISVQTHDGMVENVGDDYLNKGFESFTIIREPYRLNNGNWIPTVKSSLLYVDGNDYNLITETVTEEDNEFLDGDLQFVRIPRG